MPLTEGLLGFSAQLACCQTRPETANVEQGGVEGRQVISTWSRRDIFRQKLPERIYGHFWIVAQCGASCSSVISDVHFRANFGTTSSVGVMEIQIASLVDTENFESNVYLLYISCGEAANVKQMQYYA